MAIKPAVVPERSHIQRMEALAQANAIREYRADVKKKLKAGKISLRAILVITEDEPRSLGAEYLRNMKLYDLLLALPKTHRVKAAKILRECGIAHSKTLWGLTQRQRDALIMKGL